MTAEPLVFTLRPGDRTSFWLPADLAARMGIEDNDELTEAQWNHPEIADLREQRIRPQKELI